MQELWKESRMKSTVNDRYLELATEASKSDDEKTAEDGKKMLELFKTELEQVEVFWNQPAQVSSSLCCLVTWACTSAVVTDAGRCCL